MCACLIQGQHTRGSEGLRETPGTRLAPAVLGLPSDKDSVTLEVSASSNAVPRSHQQMAVELHIPQGALCPAPSSQGRQDLVSPLRRGW